MYIPLTYDGHINNQLLREYEYTLDALTRCEQECKRLPLENRVLNDKFNELDDRFAVLRGDLDRQASGYFVTYR
jgi:hypothetical protein